MSGSTGLGLQAVDDVRVIVWHGFASPGTMLERPALADGELARSIHQEVFGSRDCAVAVEPSRLKGPESKTGVANAQQHVKELIEAAEQADLQ